MNLNELLNLPAARLKRISALKAQIEKLHAQLDEIVVGAMPSPLQKVARKRRAMSAEARRRISLAAKARWAKIRAAKS
ncbi:MAG: hypothetical protein ACREFE_16085 [Limisphaerales bacterium]